MELLVRKVTFLIIVISTAAASAGEIADSAPKCHYEGRVFSAGESVPTGERCLSCKCGSRGGAPRCRLQVCPELPVPPPRGCVLVHRKNECCQRLVCEHPSVGAHDTESRTSLSKITAEPFEIEATENGCVANGTRYAEGSAMGSSSLCEYCYCVRGKQRCVRPRCEMPLPGCSPRYRSLASCCPVSYDCQNGSDSSAATTSTTHAPPRIPGCLVDGSRHSDGAQVRSLDTGVCERCYCLRGAVRCITLECAPPLLGCSPVFEPGKCCPVQYNCSRIITEPIYRERQDGADMALLMQMVSGERGLGLLSADLRRHREMAENATAETLTTETSEAPSTLKTPNTTDRPPSNSTSTPLTKSTPAKENITDLETDASEKKIVQLEVSESSTLEPETTSVAPEETDTTVREETLVSSTPEATTSKAPLTTKATKPPVKITTKSPALKSPSPKPAVSTKAPVKEAPEDAKTVPSTTLSPQNSSAVTEKSQNSTMVAENVRNSTVAPGTTPELTTEQGEQATETAAPQTSPSPVDRADVENDTITTNPPSPSTSPSPSTPSPSTPAGPVSPLLEALEALLNVNSRDPAIVTVVKEPEPRPQETKETVKQEEPLEEGEDNGYGTSLPPSLPNITMIPFLPEDAVVDKKKTPPDFPTSSSSTETVSDVPRYESAAGAAVLQLLQQQSAGAFSPPRAQVGGFVPRQPPLQEPGVFYPSTPSSLEGGDIMTAPQAPLPPLAELISLTTPPPEELTVPQSTRDVPLASHIRVSSSPAAPVAIPQPAAGPRACASPDGRKVAHGELLASPGPCEECRCDQGTVHCMENLTCVAAEKKQSSIPSMQDRSDPGHDSAQPSHTASSRPSHSSGPEHKIIDEPSFDLDSVFNFLFMHGESTERVPPTRQEPPPPPPLPVAMAQILKLAGCNIYGRMYRVGRIISELSGPCRECRCTDLGVQCSPLRC